MSNLTTCLYGDLDHIADMLDTNPIDDVETRMILTNICRKVSGLDKRIKGIEEREVKNAGS